jgi:hypothetical protein
MGHLKKNCFRRIREMEEELNTLKSRGQHLKEENSNMAKHEDFLFKVKILQMEV